jgi:hypothetical protein
MRALLAALLAAVAAAQGTQRPVIGILTLPADDWPGATSYFPAVSKPIAIAVTGANA